MAKVVAIQRPGTMNKTEAAYARLLAVRLAAGDIDGWEFEPVKFRLGNTWMTTYTPDFCIQECDSTLTFVEVKQPNWRRIGHQEDSNVKLKVAARQYPYFRWVRATGTPRDGFTEEEIS